MDLAPWADSNQAGPEAPIVSGDLRTARINEAFAVAASDGYLTISISAALWQASSSAALLRRNRELRNGSQNPSAKHEPDLLLAAVTVHARLTVYFQSGQTQD